MKKKYTSPFIEIIYFEVPDAVNSSEIDPLFKRLINKLKLLLPSVKKF